MVLNRDRSGRPCNEFVRLDFVSDIRSGREQPAILVGMLSAAPSSIVFVAPAHGLLAVSPRGRTAVRRER